ncbi:helix-turn-helix domain-containing protein [Nesterenkonia salmonea]|uniref:Helix-turn-helix domain-containing protein n=1 Tax=Nesterenkonia salmonea TaxID=1804987 RepID=A0A5R9BBM7_9MICC|nr:helix-turn-helix domain-containing protein [Nesterenkonia salmonea]TLP96794.1 helix-turn-helix domain-containing protein [Nesterenkonia salmonea]
MVDAPEHTKNATDNGALALGMAVRSTRSRLGLSVQALAHRAGVSLGSISQIERGLGNPSLQSIQRIAHALGVSASQLLEPPADELAVVQADKRHVLKNPEDQREGRVAAVRELLSPPADSRIQFIRTVLPVGFSNEGRPYRHIGTESITVLEGQLLVTHGDRQETLGVGDSATYGCSAPHWWANIADTETTVLGASTPIER